MSRTRKVTPQVFANAKKMILHGLNDTTIGGILGVSHSTIRNIRLVASLDDYVARLQEQKERRRASRQVTFLPGGIFGGAASTLEEEIEPVEEEIEPNEELDAAYGAAAPDNLHRRDLLDALRDIEAATVRNGACLAEIANLLRAQNDKLGARRVS